MPQGHDITLRSESYDFYLYDPHATSPDDLLTPSSDSVFHVRSRISGQMLPFLSVASIKEDANYLEEVTTALGEVVRHGGRDEDIIACLPNMEISFGNKPGISFAHLLDDTLIRFHLGDRRTAQGLGPYTDPDKQERIRQIKEKPLGRFINRHHYATSLATPISRLHSSEQQMDLRESDYRALMQEVDHLMRADDTPQDVKIALNGLTPYGKPDRVEIQDGRVTFLSPSGERLSRYGSNSLKSGFFKAIRHVMSEMLNEDIDNDTLLRFGRHVNALAYLSPSDMIMSRINANFTGDLPDRLPSGEPHPTVIAAARMVTDGNPYLSQAELLESPALDPDVTQRYDDIQYGVSPHANVLRRLSLAGSPEGQRNVFQVGERMNWSSERLPGFASDDSSLFHNGIKAHFWRKVEDNRQPLNRLLREMITQHDKLSAKEDGKPLSKRTVNLLLANVQGIDHINMCLKANLPCEPTTLFTDSGERFIVSFDRPSSGGPFAKGIEGRVTYYDNHDAMIFDHQGDLNLGKSYNHREFNFSSLLKDPLHLLQLPPGKITRYQELSAVLGCLANNRTLSTMMGDGYLRHLDQERDAQGRKVARKDYQSWMDVVIDQADTLDEITKYSQDTYLKDSDTIAEDISRALFLNLAQQAGIRVGSEHTAHDLANDNDIDKDNAFVFDNIPLEVRPEFSLAHRRIDRFNYKKDMVEMADRLHHVGATLVKNHMPQVDVDWEAATGITHLGTLPDGTQVHAEPLHSYGSIQRHGSTMRHCAGTYSSQCMSGNYYLWAIMGTLPDGTQTELSTLGMNHDGEGLEFDQHFAHDNDTVKGPLEEMVTQFSESLQVASKGHVSDIDDDDRYGYDDEDDDVDYDSAYTPPYDVDFEHTSYDGHDDDLTPEDVAEIIANYHWQGDDFGRDAMELLSRTYGMTVTQEALTDVIDRNVEDLSNEEDTPADLLTRLKTMRELVMNYDLQRDPQDRLEA